MATPVMNNWIGLTRLPAKVFSRWEGMLIMCLIDFVGNVVKLAAGEIPFVDLAVIQMAFAAKFIVMQQNADTLYTGGFGSNEPPFSDALEDQALAYQKTQQNVSAQRDAA